MFNIDVSYILGIETSVERNREEEVIESHHGATKNNE